MAHRIQLTRAATLDLIAARTWLSQPGSGHVASQKLKRIDAAIRELRHAPDRWPVGEHRDVRERPVAGYRILYRVIESLEHEPAAGIVVVLRLFGPFQDQSTI